MKTKLLTLLFLLLASTNAWSETVGYIMRADCGTVSDPVANSTVCTQTTTASGRTAGVVYVWDGAAWTQISGSGNIDGSGSANQIAIWSDSDTLAGDSGITVDTGANSITATTFIGAHTGNTSGNAGTATALAANGANCVAGSFPLGVDASGASESCTDAATQTELDAHTADSADAHAASAITNTAAGNIEATTVQAAIDELDSEKMASTATLDTVFDNGKEIDGANSSTNAVKIGNGTNKWYLYNDPTDGLQFSCFITTLNNCDYYRLLNDTKKWGVKDSAGNVELEHTEDTGITAMTVNAETSGVTITIPEQKWFPFAACQNATASLIWDSETSNAAAAACITGTNTQKGVADFDATTDESLQMTYLLPTGFTGDIDAKIMWLAAATTGSVGWCVQLIKVSDGATDDPAFPAQAAGNCVSDATKGTTLQVNTASISAVTCTSCAAGDLLHIRVSRDANGGAVTDDMAGDARGIGLELTIRRAM